MCVLQILFGVCGARALKSLCLHTEIYPLSQVLPVRVTA